jgi:hypothetical protein
VTKAGYRGGGTAGHAALTFSHAAVRTAGSGLVDPREGKANDEGKEIPTRSAPGGDFLNSDYDNQPAASAASNSSATMLVILIIGFTAGPAVSL